MSSDIEFLTVKVTPRPGGLSRLYEVWKTCYSTLAQKFPVKLTVKRGVTKPMGEEKRPILLARPPSDEEKWQLVQRVAASLPFQKTTRLRDFLLYVCERTLKRQLEDIREPSIGCAVFGRTPDYNPSEDNIVRVEARHLRKRLADYFDNEGKEEPYVILIPKGSYMPVFVPRERAESEEETVVPEPAPETQVAPPPAIPPAPGKLRARLTPYLVITGALVLVATVWLLVRNAKPGDERAGRAAARTVRGLHFPWTQVINERQTKIVLADSCLVLLEDVMGRQISLNEYVSRSYLNQIRQYENNPSLKSLLDLISSRQYTSLADVAFVGKIMQMTGGYRDNVQLSYARNLNIRDFKADNFILVGAPRANPWVELFEPKMKFEFDFDNTVKRPLFRNKHPEAGEQQIYMTAGLDGKTSESYAVVALLPNLNRTGNVLIIEGTNMEGTEAGVEFLTDPAAEAKIARALGATSTSANPFFEVLLKLRTVGGTSKDVEAVSYRTIE